MKINKLALFVLFGVVAFSLAFSVSTSIAHASYGYDDCEFYNDCDYGVIYDDCDFYNDCGYSYDDTVIENNIDIISDNYNDNYNSNYNENYNDVVVNVGGDNDYQDYPPVSGNCSVSVSRADVNDIVTWYAQGSGGSGFFTYTWTGTDGLSSYYPTIAKRYSRTGTKTAKVEITSNYETITRTCTVVIEDEDDHDNDNNDNLTASCKASPTRADIGDRVKWIVTADGGDGSYDYDWSGDENLDGDDRSINKTYRNSGRKDAKVRVESDGDRVTARCHVTINNEDVTYIPPAHDDGSIYLSSIPATGISPTMKVGLFATGLLMWSAFLAYLYMARRKEKMLESKALASIE